MTGPDPKQSRQPIEKNPTLKTPSREETLAKKAAKKSRRLAFGQYLLKLSSGWAVKIRELLGLSLIVFINFYLLKGFFGWEDTVNVFSAPLIPVLAQLTSWLMAYEVAVRFWLLIFMVSLPISFYFFIREINNQKLTAFFAALFVSLPIEPFLLTRVELGLLTEDGGHVASLTLALLSCLFLLRFLRAGDFGMGVAASLGTALVALTSPLGLFILICLELTLTFSEMLLNSGRLKMLRLITALLLAAGFCAFWYNPKFAFLIINSAQGQLLKDVLLTLLPLSFFILPVLFTFGFLLFENRPELQYLFLAVFFTIGFGLLSLGAGVQLHSSSRFLVVFGISVAFLLGILAKTGYEFLKHSIRLDSLKPLRNYRNLAAGGFLIVLTVFSSLYSLKHKQSLSSLQEQSVLGLADVKRTGIWEKRRQAGGIMAGVGNGITLLSLGSVIFFKKRLASRQTGKG